MDYPAYKHAIDAIHDSLLEEWKKIREELKDNPDFDARRLRGYLLEALFYYACLRRQALFIDVELAEMGGAKFEEFPQWFEATPLYDIVAPLHHI